MRILRENPAEIQGLDKPSTERNVAEERRVFSSLTSYLFIMVMKKDPNEWQKMC